MATVIGSNKEEHDRKFMEQRGQIPKSNNDPSIAGLKAAPKKANPYADLSRSELKAHKEQIKERLKEKPYYSWSLDNEPIFDHEGNESAGDDYARIDKLYVPEEKRSKGVGRKLLRDSIQEIQQKHPNMPIKLAALPFGKNGLDMENLVKFYESEGFDIANTEGHAVVMQHDGIIRKY